MKKDSTPEENNPQYQKDNFFKVPEGYFEKLPEDIQHRIESNKVIEQKQSSNIRRITFISGLAAAVIIIALLFSFLIKKETDENTDISLFNLSDQAITDYLADNTDENTLVEASNDDISFFDADKLKDLLTSDDTIVPNKENQSIEMDTTLKKDDILEYLLNENIDPETL